ncbi:hypothetical protein ABT247_17550 [Kitasatospora sp. NPDC001539]|uniref:hypothetical protein n=1 Tax=Kitasatospora sp. NPDC001539 TaxID=3154384 RepID=UPI003327A60A
MDRTPATETRHAVVDSGALYQLAAGHSPAAVELRKQVRSGELQLTVPMAAFSVSSSMRSCWDTECRLEHPDDGVDALRDFLDRPGLRIHQPTADFALTAGGLYADCVDRRVVGSEVLAACHSVLLAEQESVPLISTASARYCYVPLSTWDAANQLVFV